MQPIVRAWVSTKGVRVFALILVAVFSTSIHAATDKGSRFALVIGNANYTDSPLATPVNDANAMASRLRELNFDVLLYENIKTNEIGNVHRQFRSKIAPGSVVLVYYAGHSIQLKGENFLLAADAEINSEDDVPQQSIKLRSLLDNIGDTKGSVGLVFLDACRDNPFVQRLATGSIGLAKVKVSRGMLINYASQPDSIAKDGNGKLSPYTEVLLEQMSEPDIPIEMMLDRVAIEMLEKTEGKQDPWIEGKLHKRFYFSSTEPITEDNQPESDDDQKTSTKQTRSVSNNNNGDRTSPNTPPNEGLFSTLQKVYGVLQKSGITSKSDNEKAPAPLRLMITDQIFNQPKSVAQNQEVALPSSEAKRPRSLDEGNSKEKESPRQNEKAKDELTSGQTFKDCAECPEMVVMPSGSFEIGSPESENGRDKDEGPRNLINIPKPFALASHEVTTSEFRAFVQATHYKTDAETNAEGKMGCSSWDASDGTWNYRQGRSWDNLGFPLDERQPATCLSWNDAKAYVKWLSEKTGKAYRLPSEAEWEYAARSGTTTARYWGESPNEACAYANIADQTSGPQGYLIDNKHECADGYWFPAPVGSFKPNAFGVYDMIGNVSEWVEDCSRSSLPTSDQARIGINCAYHSIRGSSWSNDPNHARAASRLGNTPTYRNDGLGFRPARGLP